MKAYSRCPECGKRNISPNAENKHHYPILCVECNKLYYQTALDLNTNDVDDNNKVLNKPTEVKPDHIDPVPIIIDMIYNVPTAEIPPGKPVKRTTSQARINSD